MDLEKSDCSCTQSPAEIDRFSWPGPKIHYCLIQTHPFSETIIEQVIKILNELILPACRSVLRECELHQDGSSLTLLKVFCAKTKMVVVQTPLKRSQQLHVTWQVSVIEWCASFCSDLTSDHFAQKFGFSALSGAVVVKLINNCAILGHISL